MDAKTILKREILLKFVNDDLEIDETAITAQELQESLVTDDGDKINEIWELVEEYEEDGLREVIANFRGSGETTGLPERFVNMHYESEEVARQITGSDMWIGWTYWYGGGKHGYPEDMEWIDDAYLLHMTVEQRPVKVFTPLEQPKASQ